MTKEKLAQKLREKNSLESLLPFTEGEDCEMYKAERFEVSDNIIYIPDVDLNNIFIDVDDNSEKEIENILRCCYTGKDFLSECRDNEELARELFQLVNWQHPNIQDVLDTYDEKEFKEKFGSSLKL